MAGKQPHWVLAGFVLTLTSIAATAQADGPAPQSGAWQQLKSNALQALENQGRRVALLERRLQAAPGELRITEELEGIRRDLRAILLPLRGLPWSEVQEVLQKVEDLDARLAGLAAGPGVPPPRGAAAASSPTPALLQSGETGAIAGSVTDAATGLPLAGVTIAVRGGPNYGQWNAVTDPSGAFTVTGLPPGTYWARTANTPSGYIPELFQNVWCAPWCYDFQGTPIAVTAGTTTFGINFELERYGSIQGQVTDASTGAPIANAAIYLYDSWENYYTGTASDSNGAFTLSQIVPGTYYLVAFSDFHVDQLYAGVPCEDRACNLSSGTPVVVTAGATIAGISFSLTLSGSISGSLVDNATGDPILGTINLYNDQGVFLRSTYAYGAYSITDLVPGTYFAIATAWNYASMVYQGVLCQAQCNPLSGTPITVSSGANTGNIAFALPRLGALSGTITDAGTNFPIDSAMVTVWTEIGGFVEALYSTPSGSYLTSGLWPGQYFVRASHPHYIDELFDNFPCEPGCNPTSGTPVAATLGTVTANINFALDLAGGISGYVVARTTGHPVPDITVEVYDASGAFVRAATTGPNGYYVVRDLVSGIYFARASHQYPPRKYLGQLFQDLPCDPQCTVTSGTPITVTLGHATTGVNFSLDRLGVITGQVVDLASGQPRPDASVSIYDSSGTVKGTAQTDPLGRFVVEGLAPGNYFAVASAFLRASQLYSGIDCLGPCPITSGTPIPAAINTVTAGINFALRRLGVLSGTVTDWKTGQPLSSGWVRLYDPAGTYVAARLVTDGRFAFTDLLPGTYFAVASHSDGYVSELYTNRDCTPSCTVTLGSALTVQLDQSVGGVHFLLRKPFFGDVSLEHWARRWIETVYTHGVTVGCQSDPPLFCPLASMTRRQVAVWIAKAHSGGTVPEAGTVPGSGTYQCGPGGTSLFADVPPEDAACRYIHYLVAQGIASGCGGGLFCPGNLVTRRQMAVFTAKAIATGPIPTSGVIPGLGPYHCATGGSSVFADVAPEDFGCSYIHYLAAQGVVSGCGGGNFCPNHNLRRDQGAVLTSKAFQFYRYRP